MGKARRKLFCELSPFTYNLSVLKCRTNRRVKDILKREPFAKEISASSLEVEVFVHASMIRRKLGGVDQTLQENKATNLKLSTPKVSGILIKPGEVFSFWRLVGSCKAKDGYKDGLIISRGKTSKGIGGGMCQFSNLIHWLILHSPLDIVEHHHHDALDLFPDFNRKIPFGTGTSIFYNYIDYRFKNNTDNTFQLVVYTDDEHLHGELRAERDIDFRYEIVADDEKFTREDDDVYRNGNVYREIYEKGTDKLIKRELIRVNHARVLYDTKDLEIINK